MANLERTRQVRVTKAMDERLRKDAKTLGVSEAEAIRMGLDMLHDLVKRKQGIDWLIRHAYIPHDPDERVRLR